MKIQLYSNCILSERYTEVFRTKALLEAYLATLDSPLIQDIDIANVYSTLSGTISLDVSNFTRTFNYIKFTDISSNASRVCYAFVNKIRFINGLLVIDYVQDIWHTYLGEWSLRESLITNSQWRTVGNVSELPMNPTFNNYHIEKSGNNSVCLIAKMLFYKLNTTGEPDVEKMYEQYCLISTFNADGGITRPAQFNINQNAFYDFLDILWCNQSRKHTQGTLGCSFWVKANGEPDTSNGYYSQIEKFYVVPASFVANANGSMKTGIHFRVLYGSRSFQIYQKSNREDYGGQDIYSSALYFAEFVPEYDTRDIAIFETTLTENSRNIAVGFYSSLIKYDFNGHDINYKITMTANTDEFELYLEYEGIKTEITDLFAYTQDFGVVGADTVAQRDIANKVNTIKGITGVITSMAQIGVGVATAGAGLPSIPFTTANSPLDAFGIPIPQTMAKSPTDVARGVGGVIGGVAGMVDSITNIVAANTARYSPFYNTNNNTIGIINAAVGFVRAYVEDTDNDISNRETFNNALRETGYKVSYITDNIDIANSGVRKITEGFNVIRFGFVRIVGLSTEICEMLASILTSGVKIWYQSNV